MFLTQIINGQATELALCENCAKAKGLFDPQTLTFAEKFFPEEFRKRIDKLVRELSDAPQQEDRDKDRLYAPGSDILTRCPVCGFTLENLRRTGHLGCPDCYQVFAREIHGLDVVDTAITGGDIPTGTEPASPAVLKSQLEEQLKQAIDREDYEKAATLRDRIRSIQ